MIEIAIQKCEFQKTHDAIFFFSNQNTLVCIWLFSSQLFFSASCERSKNELEQPLWFQRSGFASWCRSEQQEFFFFFFLLPLRAAWGLFPHSGGWTAWCVSWVWPLVPRSNEQNLQNQHAQLDKVGRIIHLSLVRAPLEGGRGLELIAALHQRLFIATFGLLAFAPRATLNCGLMPE